jgi:dipeptidase D
MEATATQGSGSAFAPAFASRLIDLLIALPHGVISMSRDLPGLVETSHNLATVHLEGNKVIIGSNTRSSLGEALVSVQDQVEAIGRLAGAQVERHAGYPGWQPNMSSPLLASARKVYQEVTGEEAQVTAIHAGLECGLLGERSPGLDMISFGPTIENAHSPQERVNIGSVERFYKYLKVLLDTLSR